MVFFSSTFFPFLRNQLTTTDLQPVYPPDDPCIPVSTDFHSSAFIRFRLFAVGEQGICHQDWRKIPPSNLPLCTDRLGGDANRGKG
jgi:hypothetical protein